MANITGTLTVEETVITGTLNIAAGPAGPGVPVGGTAGQLLAKVDANDYNTEWVNPAAGGGGGVDGADGDSAYEVALTNGFVGTESEWLTSLEGADGATGTAGQGVPTGGTTGQVLSKVDASDYNTEWVDPAAGGGGDMFKSVYDTDNSGVVDNAETVNGLTVETAVPVGAVFTDTVYDDSAIQSEVDLNTAKTGITPGQAADIATNNAKISATGNELEPGDIDTLAELNAIITDATLIDTNDPRLSDARTPTAHTHTASEITDFDAEVSNNAAVAANTAKVGVTVEEQNPELISQAEAEAGTATTERIFSALRVAQAIAALGGGGGGTDGWTVVTLHTDFSIVNETTYQTPPGMSFTVPAGATVAYKLMAVSKTSVNGDGIFSILSDPFSSDMRSTSDIGNINAGAYAGTAVTLLGGSIVRISHLHGVAIPTSPSTISLGFRQATSDASPAVLRRGTTFSYKIIEP